MNTQHGEIPCSHKNIHQHGKRRRRCSECGKTWTLWNRKRGRKKRARRTKRLAATFEDKFTLAQQAHRAKVKHSTFSARHQQVLAVSSNQPWMSELPENGDLIMVADGKWYRFQGKRWTLCVMALRPVNGDKAVFLPPVALPGRESLTGWEQAIATVSPGLEKRIKALVSDGFRGVEKIVREHGWLLQRCHFHLLSRFHCMIGLNKKTVSFRAGRQQIYRTVRTFLDTADPRQLYQARSSIARCGSNKQCPLRIRRMLKELLRREGEFRAYLIYPKLRLPATSNVIESMNSQLDDLERRCRGFKTPKAMTQWTHAHIRHHRTTKCNPKKPT